MILDDPPPDGSRDPKEGTAVVNSSLQWCEVDRGGQKHPSRVPPAANKQLALLQNLVARMSAVTIYRPSSDTTLASVMRKVMDKVDMKEME